MSNVPADDRVISAPTDELPRADLSKEQLEHREREPVSLAEGKPACALPGLDAARRDSRQEADLWWGSYSGWTMIPSFLVCVVLTAVIFWLVTGYLPHRELVRLTVLGASSAVWLAQIIRWGYRFFGFNYRLTTRRFFQDKGFLYTQRRHVELARIADVRVARNRFERLMGVGRIYVLTEDKHNLVIEGVRQPIEVAKRIQEARRQQAETPQPSGGNAPQEQPAHP